LLIHNRIQQQYQVRSILNSITLMMCRHSGGSEGSGAVAPVHNQQTRASCYMKHSIRTTISVAVLCLLTLANPASAAGENDYDVTLSLGLQNSSKPSAMVRKYRPIVSLLQRKVSQRLGKRVRIRMQVAKSNQKGIEYLANGKVDFALLGAATYVEAKTEIPDIQILAIESKNRTKVVNGIIATGVLNTLVVMNTLGVTISSV